jgi:hypothetical protein
MWIVVRRKRTYRWLAHAFLATSIVVAVVMVVGGIVEIRSRAAEHRELVTRLERGQCSTIRGTLVLDGGGDGEYLYGMPPTLTVGDRHFPIGDFSINNTVQLADMTSWNGTEAIVVYADDRILRIEILP